MTHNDNSHIPTGPFLLLVSQLALLLAVAHVFLIEETYGLDRLIPIIFFGFVVHALLPLAWRGWFFVSLFPIWSVTLLGPVAATVMLALGTLLFLLCHLPVGLWMRVGILVAVAVSLAALRIGVVETTLVPMYFRTQTLPMLSAIFMFRTAIYLYDLQHEKVPSSLKQRLGYFFLFPNICFPLFPVIDYQTYKRTYFDRNHLEIYQKGIDWILRGIIHLLLYRVVYHYFVPDPLEIDDVAGVGRYVLSSFLLYLRVSGLFHLIIGILCLFGYDLPETHHRYYLSESFTDFWRRINIYWKDFMVKMFYFPIFMSLRRYGVTSAMIVATLATFFITWLLHSYQWFWLRGTFPVHPQDMIFWGVLAVLVTVNSLYEEKYGRKRRSLTKREKPSWRQALGRSGRTVSVFVIICLLWSFWTSTSINQWLTVMSIATTASIREILVFLFMLLLAVTVGVLLQVLNWRGLFEKRFVTTSIGYRFMRVGATAVALLAVAYLGADGRFSHRTASVVATITGDQLNTRDQQQVVKGYYEELLGAESSGSMVWSVRSEEPDTWRWNGRSGFEYRLFTNDMRYAEMRPNIDAVDKGEHFTTNRWGMRDQDYDKEKPASTYRIAMLGSSYTLGAGVDMAKTFPSLVEDHLNSEAYHHPADRVEVLNFAQAGYSILRRQAIFAKNALDFGVDLVVDMSVTGEAHLAVRNLRTAIEEQIPNLDPILLDIIRRAGVTEEMSSEAIEGRLGPYTDEILLWGYQQLSLTAREYGVEVLVFLLPRVDDTEVIYSEEWVTLSRITQEAGLTAVGLEGVYGPSKNRAKLKLALWDAHPNIDGHALLAERIYREFMNLGYPPEKDELVGETSSRVENDHD